jgi:glycosyltransferase involved in cell wall biosynthesis
MLRGVDARIAVSRSLAAWVRRVGGSDLDVDVIPNGVDTARFPSARSRAGPG